MRKLLATNLLLFFTVSAFFAPLRLGAENSPRDVPIEIFQVLELPVSVHQASLFKSEKGYLLKLSIANSSELDIIGLRYSLFTINYENKPQIRVNRTEGFSLPAYETKNLTFRSPIRFKPKDGERLVLMLEQVVSRESIWEVVKAKEAFEAYARGDYSVMPAVMRVANQVDAPLDAQPLIRRRPYDEE
jgi:hypothetical protein